jgi:hypothetical protein
MRTRHRFTIASLGLALALGIAGTGPASAQACLDNRQIQEAVSSGQILPLANVLTNAGIDAATTVLSVQVCDQDGQMVYVIGILSATGEAQNLVLSAL